jgi:hypothetical protein
LLHRLSSPQGSASQSCPRAFRSRLGIVAAGAAVPAHRRGSQAPRHGGRPAAAAATDHPQMSASTTQARRRSRPAQARDSSLTTASSRRHRNPDFSATVRSRLRFIEVTVGARRGCARGAEGAKGTSLPSCARWTTPASIEQSRNVCRVGCLSAAGCSRDLPKVVDEEDLVRFGSALLENASHWPSHDHAGRK